MKNIILTGLLSMIIFSLTACDGGPSGDGTVTVCTPDTVIAIFNTDEAVLDLSVEGNTTVVALGSSGIGIFDTTQKNRPELLTKIDDINGIQNTEVYSVRLHDDYLYVYLKDQIDFTYYLRIIDISNVLNPLFKSEIPFLGVVGNTDAMKTSWIGFEHDFIHLIGTITGITGNYHIIDLSDKAHPAIVYSMSIDGLCGGINVVNEIMLKDKLAYIGSYKGIDIVDFTDRSAPVLLSTTLNGCSYKSFDINADTLYTATGYEIYAYDISDPTAVVHQDHLTALTKKHILVSEVNATAYTLGLNGEVSILDVSQPNDMKDTDEDIFVNAHTYRILDDRGYIYVADEAGLKIIDSCVR